jgi:1-aminocyclopropane-1-carboxylate deaminase
LVNAFTGSGIQLDILRDDLIHPIVSGNKWRKLKYFIEQVIKDGKAPIVTFGGAYSNHLVATAYAGKYFNIKTHGFIRGDEARQLNQYEQLCIENDMTLQHISRGNYKDKKKLFELFREQYPEAVFLDEGGDHPLALQGCSDILDELENTYDYIVLAAGTGTTMEGLVKGVSERGINTRIMGISVLKNNLDLNKRMEKYPSAYWIVSHDYHRGKYASIDEELLQFIRDFYAGTAIRLDPVYTGKMMMAVMDLYQNGFFNTTQKVLVVHTGGSLSFPAAH